MSKNEKAEAKFFALRKSGFTGPIDQNGDAVMSRTDGKGSPLPLFEGGSGHKTPTTKRAGQS